MRPLWKQTVKKDDTCWGFHLCTSKLVKDAIPPTPAFLPVPSKKPGRQKAAASTNQNVQTKSVPTFQPWSLRRVTWKVCLVSFCFFFASSLKISGGEIPSPKTHQKHPQGRLRKRPPGCRSTAKCLLREAHTTRYKIDLGKSRILLVIPAEWAVEKSPQKRRCGIVFFWGGEVGNVW